VTKIELLSTPNAEDNGLPANPTVLYTWLPLVPEVAAFEIAPAAFSTSTISMKATAGQLAPGFAGPVEYRFIETTGNPGANSSGWQTSRTYTDTGLQAGTAYAYTVEMRAGSLTTSPSAVVSVTTPNAAATQSVTVDSTQQFSLQTGNGLKSVTGLGTFNASGADKLVVVISTEDANNAGTGYVYEVRYNGKVMTEAIQEDGGGNDGTAAIFYLDNPGSIGSGTIQVSAENPNGGIGCAYALSNTMPGFGASNRRTGTAANSVPLTTIGDGSVVIAVLDNAGKPNSVGTTHTATSPLIGVSSGTWGSQWGAMPPAIDPSPRPPRSRRPSPPPPAPVTASTSRRRSFPRNRPCPTAGSRPPVARVTGLRPQTGMTASCRTRLRHHDGLQHGEHPRQHQPQSRRGPHGAIVEIR
jgi:hypothetical protein